MFNITTSPNDSWGSYLRNYEDPYPTKFLNTMMRIYIQGGNFYYFLSVSNVQQASYSLSALNLTTFPVLRCQSSQALGSAACSSTCITNKCLVC